MTFVRLQRHVPDSFPPDVGCHWYPVSCLTCPFEDCIFDAQRGAEKRTERSKRIKDLYSNGMTKLNIAKLENISYTTVNDTIHGRRKPTASQAVTQASQ
jgi:hypothetical protein